MSIFTSPNTPKKSRVVWVHRVPWCGRVYCIETRKSRGAIIDATMPRELFRDSRMSVGGKSEGSTAGVEDEAAHQLMARTGTELLRCSLYLLHSARRKPIPYPSHYPTSGSKSLSLGLESRIASVSTFISWYGPRSERCFGKWE